MIPPPARHTQPTMTRVSITSAITAVECARRAFTIGASAIPRNQSEKAKIAEDLHGALEYLRELKAYHEQPNHRRGRG